MLGSKNKSTSREAINVVTMLTRCDKRYPGLLRLYADLSENAHPNYDGVCAGYSRIDEEKFTTHFVNRWDDKYRDRLRSGMELCMQLFDDEYNNIWPTRFEQLGTWLVENDEWLEANKNIT